jgi:hypothetical protein
MLPVGAQVPEVAANAGAGWPAAQPMVDNVKTNIGSDFMMYLLSTWSHAAMLITARLHACQSKLCACAGALRRRAKINGE